MTLKRIHAKSARAQKAFTLVADLQQRFTRKLNALSQKFGSDKLYEPTEWFRDNGTHGGGIRLMATDESIFNRASVNVSQVQYDDTDSKSLASASAISTIIHPKNPLAPSIHIHISWTELKKGHGYWRVMADLNPAIPNADDRQKFITHIKQAATDVYNEASAQGDRYFMIPALGRHRGVSHFYLENYSSGQLDSDFDTDFNLAKTVGESAIDTYCAILSAALETRTSSNDSNKKQQLDYHTLYFFQVLTLDKGTTSGLLVHNQNDVGTLASLPSHVDRRLLESWIPKMETPQELLLEALVSCLSDQDVCLVDDKTKQDLANVVRTHYQTYPDAIQLQASGNTIPPTVDNHK